MMKLMKLTYISLLTASLSLLTACSGDDGTGSYESPKWQDGKIEVHLRVSQAGTSSMRAWTDAANADDVEMMNVWTVVAVNSTTNKVTNIYACKPAGEPDQEVDQIVELPGAGSYRFYSFANMSPKVVMKLLNIGGSGNATMRGVGVSYPTTAGNNPTSGSGNADNDENSALNGGVTDYASGDASQGDPFMTDDNSYPQNGLAVIEFTEGATVDPSVVAAKTVGVAGNNLSPTAMNNFGAKGIPMSNVQTITVNANDNVTLVVIRMVAKIELQVYNDKGTDVNVESITLTDLTTNRDNNLKLLPKLAGNNTMNVLTHGDIQPNLGAGSTQGNMTVYPSQTISTANSTAAGTPVNFTFYVNESATPLNEFHHFFLKIKLEGESEKRYVMIDDRGETTADDSKWNYIARNDYRIIPIVLDDYKLDIIPYDFPAIGSYPASVKEEDGVYTINFHDYGHFHLLPQVTKISDSSVVPFTATTPDYSTTTWGLVDNDFSKSWSSWTDATKSTPATDDGSFYRSGYTEDPPVDGDGVGGFPVWYPNTAGNPQWDPAASGKYQPFIFGYIEDPGAALTEDKKIYHEFSIYLYKQGLSAPRQMTYRLYMILDKDQAMYSRRFGAPRVLHTHGY